MFNGDTSTFNTQNPSRRDVATLPGNGYLAIAFLLDVSFEATTNICL